MNHMMKPQNFPAMPVIDDDRQTQSLPRPRMPNRQPVPPLTSSTDRNPGIRRQASRSGSQARLPSPQNEVTFLETTPSFIAGPLVSASLASAGTSNITAGGTLISGSSPTMSARPLTAVLASRQRQLDPETLALFQLYPICLASNSRNIDFHLMFRSVPDNDRLVEDFACAYQQDILLQGRMFISREHICFNANIFGWVTNLVIAFADIVNIERKMSALIIPNAVLVTTANSQYYFASFMYREQAFSILWRLWKAGKGEYELLDIPVCGNVFIDQEEDEATEPEESSATESEFSDNEIDCFSGSEDNASIFESNTDPLMRRRPLTEARERAHATRSLSPQRSMAFPEASSEPDQGPVSDSEFVKKRRFSFSKKLFRRGSMAASSAESIESNGMGKSSSSLLKNSNAATLGSDASKTSNVPTVNRATRSRVRTESVKRVAGQSLSRKSSKTVVHCNCQDHCKSIVIDNVFAMPAEEVISKVFADDLFLTATFAETGYENVKMTAWRKVDGIERRKLTYDFPLRVAFAPRTTPALVIQKYTKKEPGRCYCIREHVTVPQAAYGTAFVYLASICVTAVSKRSCRVFVAFELEFTKSSWLRAPLEKSLLEQFISFWQSFETRLSAGIQLKSSALSEKPDNNAATIQQNAASDKSESMKSAEALFIKNSYEVMSWLWEGFAEPLAMLIKQNLYTAVLPALIALMAIWNMYTIVHVRHLENKLAEFDRHVASIDLEQPVAATIALPQWWFEPVSSHIPIPEDHMSEEYFDQAIEEMDDKLLQRYESILDGFMAAKHQYLDLHKQHLQLQLQDLKDTNDSD